MTTCCVYILYSESLDKYYVGATEDLDQRIHIHNHPHESRKFTAKGLPWILKCRMDCSNKEMAFKVERRIKSMKSRKFIERLIQEDTFRQDFIGSFSHDC